MNAKILFAAVIAANLVACGQQQEADATPAAAANEASVEASAMETVPVEVPAVDGEAEPTEGEVPAEVPALEGMEMPAADEATVSEAAEAPPVE